MSKRERNALEADFEYAEFRRLSLAISISMVDDDTDLLVIQGIKRPRRHAFWMSPFLRARTDMTQRNTLAKLESDFIRVSI